MISMDDIYVGAIRLIHELIRTEFRAQGHSLTGAWEDSLESKIVKGNILQGYALSYGKVVDEGILPENISPRMIPGLIEYFIKRGLDPIKAKQAATATLRKWMQEGMSTQASKRFSSTGARQNFIEAAFANTEIDEYFVIIFDASIDEHYRLTKSETI